MITEKDRIKTCVEKYGLTEEYAKQLVRENDMVLTVEELRMKFDNPDLGNNYPEWLTPIDHYKMCCATVKQMYNGNFAKICTPEELASTLFIMTSLKLNTLNSHQHLKAAIVTSAMRICRDDMRRQKYWSNTSLDATVDEDNKLTAYDKIEARNIEQEELDCLDAVMSIKNREVRELLVLIGFIIGRIQIFRDACMDILHNSEYVNRDALLELLENVINNDDIDVAKFDDKTTKFKKTRINLASILKVYKTDLDITNVRLEIGEYLMSTGFIPLKSS